MIRGSITKVLTTVLIATGALVALGLWLNGQSQAAAAFPLPDVSSQSQESWSGELSGTLELTHHLYLPLVVYTSQPVTMTELRAVWVSRFDWTRDKYTPTVADVQHLVDIAKQAGFNTILFQVRGAGDAYYTPGLEPWASRLTGTLGPSLGQDPGWDPLAEMISRAHAAGLQVHAWVNVYPAWLAPPSSDYGSLFPRVDISPPQALNRFTYGPSNGGEYGLGYTWRVYDRATITGYMPIAWNQYTWASPAVPQVQDHVANVVADLVARYDVDGIHLDNMRYPGSQYSLDPFTLDAYARDPLSQTVTITDWRPNFQRAQVSQLVARITAETHAARPTVTVSAAVWPVYKNVWDWPAASEGYSDYYQDSQSWMLSGTIDAIMPMLYSSSVITDLEKWTASAADFEAHSGGRWVIPGIGVTFNSGPSAGQCVSFEEIAARIQAARDLGTAGQAIFAISSLENCGYLDALRTGPYTRPAPWPPSP
jgi:uncharacterized lipoprotein YddW (UPF0748 family)